MENILCKIGVGMGKGTAHVVILAASPPHQLLKLGHDLLIAAHAVIVHTAPVVDLLPSVQRKHHIAHFPVGKLDHIVVNEHTVGGKGKPEVLIVNLLLLPGILHQFLAHIPVHQRFTTEEVHLQIVPGTGVGDQEVQRFLTGFQTHQCPLPVILALAGKAVATVEIAGMGHMQAHGLEHGVFIFKIEGHIFINVRGEKFFILLQIFYILQTVKHILLRQVFFRVSGNDLTGNFLWRLFLIHRNDVIGHLVHHMDRSAAGVQNDVIAV